VLLARGAAHVTCVDVGRGQLHEKLRRDPRVTNLEATHIGKLAPGALQPPACFAVVDVSFISLRQVLPAILAQLADGPAEVVALIKPQFEVGRAAVAKGGIVKDADARQRAVDDVLAAARALGLEVAGVRESPVTGADGNIEYLAILRRP
jgi:23S rRNA (cytidine1920-2'-O)/16S rRNA (cytidine1409-2'-O)-methyltransferase